MPMVLMRDHQSVHVRVIGRGTPVLMLHGVGMDSRHWMPYIAPLLHRFRFYLPDFRGAGKSAATPFSQADVFANLAQDVEDIIRYFDLKDFLLVGYSLGASTSLHVMQNGGFGQVRRYLHIDQSPTIANPADGPFGLMGSRQTDFFATLSALHAILDAHPQVEYLHGLPKSARVRASRLLAEVLAVAAGQPLIAALLRHAARSSRLFSLLARNYRLDTMRHYLWSYFNLQHDYRDALRNTNTPITFFVGKQSILYDFNAQQAMGALPRNARVVCFERGGHLLKMEQPLLFMQELRRFLTEDECPDLSQARRA